MFPITIIKCILYTKHIHFIHVTGTLQNVTIYNGKKYVRYLTDFEYYPFTAVVVPNLSYLFINTLLFFHNIF